MGNTLIQEKLNAVFQSALGQQIDSFYLLTNEKFTRIFLRYEEATDFVDKFKLLDYKIDE